MPNLNTIEDFENKIICGSTDKVLSEFPNNCIDLTVCSPPYDNLRKYKGYSFPFEDIARQLYRVTKEGCVVVWIVGDAVIDGSESGTSFKQVLYFKEIGFNIHDTMIYMKNGAPYPEKTRYYQVFEYMFVLSKGMPKTANLLKDKKNKWAGGTNFGVRTKRAKDGTLKKYDKTIVGKFGLRYNIWNYSTGKGYTTKDDFAYEHPALFPEQLAMDHIISWSNEKDIILDPFCGAGTTLKMAKKSNRSYIGIDISEEYCKLSEKRIKTIPENSFI